MDTETARRIVADAVTNSGVPINRRENESVKRFLQYLGSDSIPAQAVKSAWSGLTYPGDVLAGKAAPDDIGRALDAAGLAGTGAVGAALTRSRPSMLAAQREMEHDPPIMPQRPFEADYPNGAITDEAGRLQYDIEGRPLSARYIAGRTHAGLPDRGLNTEELEGIVQSRTMELPARVPREELEGASGGTFFDLDTGQPQFIAIADDIHPNDVSRVLGHETGHVIDQTVGNIPSRGIEDELRQNYDTLLTGNQPGPRQVGPEDIGYPADQVDRELFAEAIRAYLADPNYIKTIGPESAARIREYVNSHPELKDIIQFNSGGLPLGAFGPSSTPPAGMDEHWRSAVLSGRAT